MNGLFRFSSSRLALGYIALSVLGLALFAVPLWYAWNVNISTFKAYVQEEDLQGLMEGFDRGGVKGLAAAMDSRAASVSRDEIMVLADASKRRLAGNLRAWPAEVPDAPGTYGLVIGLGDGSSMRIVATHTRLPGGQHLLVGRESVRFQSLEGLFWYGIMGATSIVLVLGFVFGWMFRRALLSEVRGISRAASAIVEGDLSRRLVPPDGSDELAGLARTVNGMLEQLARAHGGLEELVAQRTAELARANASLSRSEAFLAEGQRISHTGSWGWELSSGKVAWSEEQYRMLGFDPGRTEPSVELFLGAIHAEDRPRVQKTLEEATREKRHYSVDYRVVLADGSIRHLRSVGRPVASEANDVGEYIGITADTTERVQAEAALLARQRLLDLAQKAARAEAFEWRIGAEVWGKAMHPEDWPVVQEAIERAKETGELACEYRVVHPDGSVRWLQAKGRMLLDEGPARIVGFVLDVTERRDAEDELRRMERRLRQSQRLEAMGTLAGGIAHDFNNILAAILGYSEMALRDAPKGSRLRRDLTSISAAGERGRALVDRILAFSRSGGGERIAVHVEKVVGEALDLFAAKLPDNVSLTMDLHAGRAAIQGDPTQIHQLLMNLATNSVQAMAGGGTLHISLSTLRLDAQRAATTRTLLPGNYIVLAVADSGGGIPAATLDRIFDPFFTTKEVGVGTGLGLSLVHGIATELGGAVDVASTVGEGSVFTVYLPRTGDAMEDLEHDVPGMPRGDGQRVLIVDDEQPLARLATETLEELGYAPVCFTSSTAALSAFRADPRSFDAVITDERMPVMSGSALIGEMRGIRRNIPILLMSGYLGGNVATRAFNAGADEVLRKPVLASELATTLARALLR